MYSSYFAGGDGSWKYSLLDESLVGDGGVSASGYAQNLSRRGPQPLDSISAKQTRKDAPRLDWPC